jgi:hypothetical protein
MVHRCAAESRENPPGICRPVITYERPDEPPPGLIPPPSAIRFPALKTQERVFMLALMTGKLVLETNYLRVGDTLVHLAARLFPP